LSQKEGTYLPFLLEIGLLSMAFVQLLNLFLKKDLSVIHMRVERIKELMQELQN